MVVHLSSDRLQKTLQSVVQSIQWTYSLFWQLCPQQRKLMWSDGYYNGAIKTRKMMQPMELSSEEASLQRSQQLKELYNSLLAGEANQEARRPSAALSPEDLTDSEWFYLMCVSFSFPPGVGLPGKAFAKRRHIWLIKANEANNKNFSRAILAKSARVQTVVCIPIMDGVLELGTTKKVEEDAGLIQHAKRFFMEFHDIQTKPSFSEHSTSSPVAYIEQPAYHSRTIMQQMSIQPHGSNKEGDINEYDDDGNNYHNDEDEDDDQNDDSDEDDVETSSKSEVDVRNDRVEIPMPTNLVAINQETVPIVEPSELMQLEKSEEIRVGSDYCSNELDTTLGLFAACQDNNAQNDNQRLNDDCYQAWNFIHEDLCNTLQQPSGTSEDVHCSEAVSSVLQYNLNRWTGSRCFPCLPHDSRKSAFSNWSAKMDDHLLTFSRRNSQWVLKQILFSIPNFYCKYKNENSDKSRDEATRKGNAQEELSASHVLAERRRREKINERFIILRSLVPFVTKMDKTSILGDTIEYIKRLKRRIHDLEIINKQTEIDRRLKAQEIDDTGNSKEQNFQFKSNTQINSKKANQKRLAFSEKKKMRLAADEVTLMLEPNLETSSTNVQVSIIDYDALLELQCQYREGLLLRIMQTLNDLQLEVTSIQCSTVNSIFIAELRAKVKEAERKKVSIVDVKKAMKLIFSSN